MKTIHLNEQMQICADQQNPFVQNKPYNPDQVLGYVIKHLLGNVYPVSVVEEQTAQHLYITTVQYFLSRDMPVTEANIVKHLSGIKGELPQVQKEILGTRSQLAGDMTASSETDSASVSNTPTGTTPAPTGTTPAPTAGQAASPSKKGETITCGGIVLKKEWVKWGVIAILILVVIKILK